MKVLVKNTFYGGFNLEVDGAQKIENLKVESHDTNEWRVAADWAIGRKLYRADLKA